MTTLGPALNLLDWIWMAWPFIWAGVKVGPGDEWTHSPWTEGGGWPALFTQEHAACKNGDSHQWTRHWGLAPFLPLGAGAYSVSDSNSDSVWNSIHVPIRNLNSNSFHFFFAWNLSIEFSVVCCIEKTAQWESGVEMKKPDFSKLLTNQVRMLSHVHRRKKLRRDH